MFKYKKNRCMFLCVWIPMFIDKYKKIKYFFFTEYLFFFIFTYICQENTKASTRYSTYISMLRSFVGIYVQEMLGIYINLTETENMFVSLINRVCSAKFWVGTQNCFFQPIDNILKYSGKQKYFNTRVLFFDIFRLTIAYLLTLESRMLNA